MCNLKYKIRFVQKLINKPNILILITQLIKSKSLLFYSSLKCKQIRNDRIYCRLVENFAPPKKLLIVFLFRFGFFI